VALDPRDDQEAVRLMSETLDPAIYALYRSPVPSSRVGALANAFSYPTKISPESVALFIATHTNPGDTVLDVFGGSGSTGLAALLCDRPTERMREMAAHAGVSPTWGPRHAVVYELSVLGAFVADVMCHPPDAAAFVAAANLLLDEAEADLGWAYATVSPEGQPGTIRHVIWTEVVGCPACGAETTYWDATVREAPLHLAKEFTCGACGRAVQVRDCDRVTERVIDPLLDIEVSRRLRRPARVYGVSDGRNWQRPATVDDLEPIQRLTSVPLPDGVPIAEVELGDLYRSGYHQGITHLHHFYTERNFLAIAHLWDKVQTTDVAVRDALKLLILSFNATHSTLMTRVVVKNGEGDFALTGAQSGVLYISGLPVEKNVFLGLRRKIRTLAAAFQQVDGGQSSVDVVNGSSTRLLMPDGSVDYAFTDPPFGDFIPYAEINQLNELWLGRVTDKHEEVVISAAQKKTAAEYGDLMRTVFSELSRVLKDAAMATIVFHSARADVWQALSAALREAGLSTLTTSVLDKTQSSFKQTVSSNSVKGDPLILVSKASIGVRSSHSVQHHVDATFAEADKNEALIEQTQERMYSRFVARCLEAGVAVELDAADFYRLAQDRKAGSLR